MPGCRLALTGWLLAGSLAVWPASLLAARWLAGFWPLAGWLVRGWLVRGWLAGWPAGNRHNICKEYTLNTPLIHP